MLSPVKVRRGEVCVALKGKVDEVLLEKVFSECLLKLENLVLLVKLRRSRVGVATRAMPRGIAAELVRMDRDSH